MSRTKRNPNPRLFRNWKTKLRNRDGTVRDGSPTRHSSECENHGSCEYCRSNKLHKYKRAMKEIEL